MTAEQLEKAIEIMLAIKKLDRQGQDIDVTDVTQQDIMQLRRDNLELELSYVAYQAKTKPEVLWSLWPTPNLPVIHTLGVDGSSTWHDEHTDGCNNRFSHKKCCTCAIDLADDVGACVNGSPDDGCDACNMRDEKNTQLGW